MLHGTQTGVSVIHTTDMSAFTQSSSFLLSLFFLITNTTDGLSEALFKVKTTMICFEFLLCPLIDLLRWRQTYQVPTLLASQRRVWRLSPFWIVPPDASIGNRGAATAMLSGWSNQISNFETVNSCCKLLTLPRLIDNSFWKRQNYVHFNSFAVLATQAQSAI